MVLGASVMRSGVLPVHMRSTSGGVNFGDPMAVDSADSPETHTAPNSMALTRVGTPMRLAPATAAFKKSGEMKPTPMPMHAGGLAPGATAGTPPPSKSLVGQVSDLIFGW